MTIAVFGSLNADLNLTVARHPQPGETLLGGGGRVSAGGKGANQALAAALTGHHVMMIGQVGKDANAQVVVEFLQKAGVDLSFVRQVDTPTGLAVVTVEQEGENFIIVVPGANGAMNSAEIEWINPALHQADILVMQAEIPQDCILEAAKRFVESGKRVVLNLAPAIAVNPWLLLHSNPLVVNESESRLAASCLGLNLNSAEDIDVAKALLEAGVPSVVLTLGSQGSLLGEHTSEGSISVSHLDAIPVQAMDAVGAGDAFTGVLAAKLAEGQSLQDSALAATRFASETVKYPGAQSSYWQAVETLKGNR